ncbi:MAG: bifunctional phosphopantothenoylcysteine decarboxylase/phosphopantothenate--cysteine ligase CoaBC [Archangiaceae bacterium]|nr:bifunctional phosphopantothenoylcysteine decarboxylase/phosphopantothenate--cysteine ligase CoaBC [Archangiaceae bacterium]
MSSSGYLRGRRIALCVGGGIAAYKTADLTRELMRAGATVRIAMTPAAREFITPLTLQSLSGHPVFTDPFDPAQDSSFGHLHLPRWADAFVIAPATADLLARIRAGMGNDAVTTALLAFRGPVLLAPAMNTAMWENPVTKANVAALLADRRFRMVGPDVGPLADGDVGAGRLAELPKIVAAAAALAEAGPLAGKRVLLTAGPTREHLDPVRYLSNPSSGKMGLALADAARARGAHVTVVLGPVSEPVPDGLEVVRVVSADEMHAAVMQRLDGVDVFLACAAVSDFKPAQRAAQKVKKDAAPAQLELVRNPDILLEASAKLQGRALIIGFAAESEEVLAHAQKKLAAKKLDFIVANDTRAFEASTNAVTVLGKDGSVKELQGEKRDLAAKIWETVCR